MSEADWMKEALALAAQADAEGEVPVGAIVLRDGAVIGRGYNLREKLQSPISHAEIHAITEASKALGSWRLERCQLYVTLEPCPMCLAACQQARIEKVVYGAKDPKGGALSLGFLLHQDARLNHRFEAEYRESPECGRILTAFFAARRSGARGKPQPS